MFNAPYKNELIIIISGLLYYNYTFHNIQCTHTYNSENGKNALGSLHSQHLVETNSSYARCVVDQIADHWRSREMCIWPTGYFPS